MRFDVPVVGVATIEAMRAAGATAHHDRCREDAGRGRRAVLRRGRRTRGIGVVGRAGERSRAWLSRRCGSRVIGVGHLGQASRADRGRPPGRAARRRSSIRSASAPLRRRPTRARGPSTDYRELFGQVDAVTVAAPTELHHEIALAVPRARRIGAGGKADHADGRRRRTRSSPRRAQSGATLAAGHTERYNPAIATVMPLVSTPRFIEVHRLGVFPDRSLDIDVVFDLMIHDLDIILALVKSEVTAIEAVGVPVLTDKFDIANARLRFATRLHRERHRQPHQQGARAEDPLLPARRLHLDRLRGAGGRGLSPEAPRRAAPRDPGRASCRSTREEPLKRELDGFRARRPREAPRRW